MAFHRTINKFNGNLCLSVDTDTGSVVVECGYMNGTVSHLSYERHISCIRSYTPSVYLVSFRDGWIGSYNGTVISNYVDMSGYGISRVDRFDVRGTNEYYLLDRNARMLYKVVPPALSWSYTLSSGFNRKQLDILLRPSEGIIVVYDRNNVEWIRDDLITATFMEEMSFEGSENLRIVSEAETNPEHVYFRHKLLTEEEMEYTSSSSTSSSSYSYSSYSLSSSSIIFTESSESSTSSSSSYMITSSSSSSSISSSSSSSVLSCVCSGFSMIDAVGTPSSKFSNWNLSKLNEHNTDNCDLYVRTVVYGRSQEVYLYKNSGAVTHVASGRRVSSIGAGTIIINPIGFNIGPVGSVHWDGTNSHGEEADLLCL